MNSRKVIQALQKDGWELVRTKGSHHHFKHPTKTGVATVAHPSKDIPIATLKRIEKQSGVKLN